MFDQESRQEITYSTVVLFEDETRNFSGSRGVVEIGSIVVKVKSIVQVTRVNMCIAHPG